jgi:hypothetical protein
VGEVKNMPLPSTPRLCAHCGAELRPAESTVTVEDARSGEQRHLHQACFEAAYATASAEADQAPGPEGDPSLRQSA